jgi:chaperonin GroES
MSEKFPVKMVGNLVVVEEIETKISKGGIHLPLHSDSGPPRVKVIAVGPGRRNPEGEYVEMCVKPGDMVFLRPTRQPEELPIGEKTYWIVSEDQVVGIITDPKVFEHTILTPKQGLVQ